jgi:hypothetical protein
MINTFGIAPLMAGIACYAALGHASHYAVSALFSP